MQQAIEHWSEAYGLAMTITRNAARAEELCQEAFVRLGTMRRDPDLTRPVRELLLTIVRNLALSDRRRAPQESLDAVMADGHTIPDPAASDPAEQADRREQQATVQAALDQLNPTWRAMLYLRDGLSLSYRQIAEILEKSEDVVRVTLHRARHRVREILEPQLEGDRS